MSLCYSIVHYYNGPQRYEQFLQVSWLYRALILLGLALCIPSAFMSSVSCTALRSGTSTVSRRYRTRRLASCIRLPFRRQQLHWLPIIQRIRYKLATLTFKVKYCRTHYLHEQLWDHQVARTLRSTTAALFYRPFMSTVFASRAFCNSAPQVWNCLGTSTRSANTFSSFRRCLKSQLFAAAYDT